MLKNNRIFRSFTDVDYLNIVSRIALCFLILLQDQLIHASLIRKLGPICNHIHKRFWLHASALDFSILFDCNSCLFLIFVKFLLILPLDVGLFLLLATIFSVDCFVIDDIGNMVSKLQIFNEFNARKPDEFNIFKGVTKNYLFMGIVGLTVVLQVSFAWASPVV